MLERFREAKQEEIKNLRSRQERENNRGCDCNRNQMPIVPTAHRPSFGEALRRAKQPGRSAVVAEYKRASPSQGDINLTLTPEDAARRYAEAGAAAVSVLTESRYFRGELSFLERAACANRPLLRKDFIFHPLQVMATAETPASALLVVVRMLDDGELAEVLNACVTCGLEPVCEIFSTIDLERLHAYAQKILDSSPGRPCIVQVNNRDLDTLKTDLALSRDLIPRKREGELWISASGYQDRRQIEEMESLGFDAFLVGTSLMGGSDPAAALSALIGGH
jgi:indole-3-glycerol phosphate synthase